MPYRAIFPALFSFLMLGLYFKLQVFLNDADTGWHIAAGKYYIQHGFTLKDPFSFSAANYDWLNISWLWDVIFASIHNIGGLYYVALVSAIIAALLLVFVFRQAALRSNMLSAFIIIMLGSFSLMPAFLARPHLAALGLLSIAYYAAVKNKFWALPLIMLLLVNMHGSFMGIFTIIAAFALEALLQKENKKFMQLVATGAACLLVTFITPLGFHIYAAVHRTLGGSLQDYIEEWQSFVRPQHFILPVISLFIMFKDRRNQKISDISLYAIWFIAGITATRYMAIFTVLCVPMLAQGFYNLNILHDKSADFEKDFSGKKLCRFFIALSVVLVIGFFLAPKKLGFDAQKFPVEETEYLLHNFKEPRMFNHYNYGGYLIYKNAGKDFIDGRAETAFPPEVVADFTKFLLMQPGWEHLPGKYKADLIMLPLAYKGLPELEALGWRPIYKGRAAIILQNRAS